MRRQTCCQGLLCPVRSRLELQHGKTHKKIDLQPLWIWGWQPAHSSLWCMKAIISGSYLLHLCWLLHGGQCRPPYAHWAVSLLSREAAVSNIVDCSGTILGGVVAYHIAAKTQEHQGLQSWLDCGLVLGFLSSWASQFGVVPLDVHFRL